MELTEIPEDIRNELMQAHAALAEGNEGKARVCARRAVGKAFNQSNYFREITRVVSANEILKLLSSDARLSAEVRTAARRLAASVMEEGISKKPVEDALMIIEELLRRKEEAR